MDIKYELIPYDGFIGSKEFDFDKAIYDLNSQIELLSSQADNLDYVVAIASGIACGLLDILWVGEFDLTNGRSIASDKVDAFVKKTAEMFEGEKFDDVKSAVKALEKRFPIPSDGNTPDFGGGLQHHLRDFAHHPTIVGLAFSLLTQFTEKSYGTDVNGVFLVVDVPEKSKPFIGKDVPQKILMGTITWFFHLVSDVAGSSSTAGVTGGTGIPGPILALAKEISAIPFFKDIKVDDDMSLSLFLSKLFNGTLMMQRDENGQIIKESVVKFDLRGELGVAVELCKQAVPVIANECIVRAFYFIRRLAMAMKEKCVSCLADMKKIDWNSVKPANNPTIARMLTVSTGVFTALDMGEAIATQKYWVSINYVGVGRFAVAIGSDVSWGLKARNVKKVRDVYENIKQQTFRKADADIYKRIGADMDIQMDKLGLSLEQTEILYNLEYYKTLNDIERTNIPITREGVKELKTTWLQDWAKFISDGFESFTQVPGAKMHWYTMDELQQCIAGQNPNEPWYRLILLTYDRIALPQDNTAVARIDTLVREGLLTRDLATILHGLRKVRNKAVHENYSSVTDSKNFLLMAYGMCEWFMQTYGDWSYTHKDFVMPEENVMIVSVDKEAEEKKEAELAKQAEENAANAPKVARDERKKQANKVANQRPKTEAETRFLIDEQLRMVGWEADTENIRYSKGVRPTKGRKLAIAEYPTNSTVGNRGYADYALFIGEKLVGIIEAKAIHKDIPSVIDYQGKCN